MTVPNGVPDRHPQSPEVPAPDDPGHPPCPVWCERHWPAGTGLQHLSTGIRYASGTVQLERFDTATTEGVTAISIERLDDGESLLLAAVDVDSLIVALTAVVSEAVQ